MTGTAYSLQRHSRHLMMRGSAVALIALLAVVNADRFFYNALLGVSALSVAYGYYETTIRIRREPGNPRYDLLPLLSGILSVGFGMMSVGLIFSEFSTAVTITAAWFLFHALCLAVAAAVLRAHFLPRAVLASLSALHGAVGLLVLLMPAHPRISILAIPVVGTLYAAAYGIWQCIAGLWLQSLANHLPPVAGSENSRNPFTDQSGTRYERDQCRVA